MTKRFPQDEQFGLTHQLRRAATSVPLNIAEGRGRGTDRDYRRFLLQARGSLYEIETILVVASRLGYLGPEQGEQLERQTREVIRPLNGLIKSLGEEPARRSPRAAR